MKNLKHEKIKENVIWLITPKQFEQLPDGTVLIAIDKERVVKGVDKIDMEDRFGHMAYGVSDRSILDSRGMSVNPRARYETNW